MKFISWWNWCMVLILASCGGGSLKHMNAAPYVEFIQRPNSNCPHPNLEQGIMNKHPDATVLATVSGITGANVITTTQMSVKPNQTQYIGCTVLPSGQNVDRKILNVKFE